MKIAPETLFLIVGYTGSVLNVVAFFMKAPIRLRQIAIVANVALAIFGGSYHIIGLFISNSILVPLNIYRLRGLYETRAAVRSALAVTDLSWDWMRPFMTRRRFNAGTTIFHKGDLADEIYFVLDGNVRLDEFGVDLGIGKLFGEIAMFSPSRQRTATARVTSDATMLTLSSDELIALYEKNPQFGIYLIRTITARLLQDLDGTQASVALHSGAMLP